MIKRSVLLFCMAVCCLFFLSVYYAGRDLKERKITVVLRFDDYAEVPLSENAVKLLDVFRKNAFPLTVGVTPYDLTGDPGRKVAVPLTPDRVVLLKEAVGSGYVEVALHGYVHQPRHVPGYKYTEFAGVDYHTQLMQIRTGRELLQKLLGVEIPTFIPPWNSYDVNTLRTLEALGFRTISANRYGEVIARSGLNFLPATCGLAHVREAVASARHSLDRQPVIVVLFHSYDFLDVNKDLGKLTYQDLQDLVTWLKAQHDVKVMSIDQAVREEALGAKRYAHDLSFWKGLMPNVVLNKLYPGMNYAYLNISRRMVAGFWVFYLLSLFLVFSTAWSAAFFMRLRAFGPFRLPLPLVSRGAILLLLSTHMYFFIDPKFSYGRAVVLALCWGWNAGIFYQRIKHRH